MKYSTVNDLLSPLWKFSIVCQTLRATPPHLLRLQNSYQTPDMHNLAFLQMPTPRLVKSSPLPQR